MAGGVVVGGALNVRGTASTGGNRLGQYSDGTYVDVTSYNSEWYKVTYNGQTGYVLKAYVVCVGETARMTGTNVNVRSGPGTGYSILYTLVSPVTTTVKDIGKDSSNMGWCQIQPSGRSAGWMRGDYMEKASGGGPATGTVFAGFVNATDYVNRRTGPSTDYEVAGSMWVSGGAYNVSTFAGVGTTNQQRSWLCYQSGGTYSYVFARYIKAVPSSMTLGQLGYVSGQNANLRELPGMDSVIIKNLGNGTEVRVIDSSVSGWYRVVTNSGTGWVSRDLITLR